jgi:hypothetical protein
VQARIRQFTEGAGCVLGQRGGTVVTPHPCCMSPSDECLLRSPYTQQQATLGRNPRSSPPHRRQALLLVNSLLSPTSVLTAAATSVFQKGIPRLGLRQEASVVAFTASMADIFLSICREDHVHAARLAAALESLAGQCGGIAN